MLYHFFDENSKIIFAVHFSCSDTLCFIVVVVFPSSRLLSSSSFFVARFFFFPHHPCIFKLRCFHRFSVFFSKFDCFFFYVLHDIYVPTIILIKHCPKSLAYFVYCFAKCA